MLKLKEETMANQSNATQRLTFAYIWPGDVWKQRLLQLAKGGNNAERIEVFEW